MILMASSLLFSTAAINGVKPEIVDSRLALNLETMASSQMTSGLLILPRACTRFRLIPPPQNLPRRLCSRDILTHVYGWPHLYRAWQHTLTATIVNVPKFERYVC